MRQAVLFGNGLNLKFGGSKYLNGRIIRRGFSWLRQDHKIYPMVPPETVTFFSTIYTQVPDILAGKYDDVENGTQEEELIRFKRIYADTEVHNIGDIGLEDYFLIIHIIYSFRRHHHIKIDDANVFSKAKELEASECIRDMFLVGIYNGGKINQLYRRYSPGFVKFINTFDSVYTTNYDANLDCVYKGEVQHLHGQFNRLDQRYDPKSLRNKLFDDQFVANNLVNVPGYEYLHSTALMDYSGNRKRETINKLNNLAQITEQDIRRIPDGRVDPLEKQLALEAVQLKSENSSLNFQTISAFDDFQKFEGTISVVGLSTANDNHIFGPRQDVQYVYYYFSVQDRENAENVLPNSTTFIPVAELWSKF